MDPLGLVLLILVLVAWQRNVGEVLIDGVQWPSELLQPVSQDDIWPLGCDAILSHCPGFDPVPILVGQARLKDYAVGSS